MELKNQHLELLRQRAEQIIFSGKNSIDAVNSNEVKKIFHELQVQQLELEMQNDELQKTSFELEQQNERFSNLFELAPIGYFVTNINGLIQDVNQAGLKLLNYQKYNLINKPFYTCINKDDFDNFYIYQKKLFLTSKAQTIWINLISKDKQIFNVQIEGIALNNALCYLTITDFTGRQKVAQQLKEAYQTLEIALDASATGIWEIDIATGKFYLDGFCCWLYGCNLNDFDGKYDTILEKIHQADRKNFDDNIRKSISKGEVLHLKFRIILPDKNSIRYIQARAQTLKDQDNKPRFIGTFTDITEKSLMEQEAVRIRTEQEQMILAAGLQAEENEKKRISEVLHNGIAQMLYAIKLNMGTLKEHAPQETFNQVNELLNQSIRDIRNISFELMPSILNDFGLAATLEDMAQRLSNQKLTIAIQVNQLPKTLNMQLQLNIFRMIQELINNSIKHGNASKIKVEVSKVNKTITVTVTDNGLGFTHLQNEAPKGAGLSSIKNRLRLYKGNLQIESEPAAGTTVHITLKSSV